MSQDELIGIFLDADGVLWPDNGPGEILKQSNLEESKARLGNFLSTLGRRESFFVTIVTNQTLAARGKIPYLLFRKHVHRNLGTLLSLNLIDHFQVCFHHPDAQNIFLRRSNCNCRKPSAGMLLKTIKQYRVQGNKSLIIGDRITDIAAGAEAKLLYKILILNEKSLEVNRSKLGKHQIGYFQEFSICRDLTEAAEMINEWYKYD